MKALVLSGGGSAGPYHLGVMEHLHGTLGMRYDMYVGVSVGALISAKMAMYPSGEELKGLLETRKLFLKVKTKHIWKHWSGGILTSLLPWMKKTSLINSTPLEKLVRKLLSHKRLLESDKKLIVGAVSLTSGKYQTFAKNHGAIVEAVLASASYPVFFKPVKVYNEYYSDGGVRTVTPIEAAIRGGATHIDVVTCIPKEGEGWSGSSVMDNVSRTLGLMSDQIVDDDLARGLKLAEERGVTVRFWRPRKQVVEDPLEFKPSEAKKAYAQGHRDAKAFPNGMRLPRY